MEALVAQIATAGNVAVLVLMVGCGALYRMLKEERGLDRTARTADAVHCAGATDRQTQAVLELTKVLVELRLDMATRRQGVRSP